MKHSLHILTTILLLASQLMTVKAQDSDNKYGIRYDNSILRIGRVFDGGNSQIQINDLGALRLTNTEGYPLTVVLANSSKAYIIGGASQYRVMFQNKNTGLYNSLRVGTVFTNADPPRVEIEDIPDNASARILARLEPVSYNFKGQSETHLGFIAQDVESIVPEIISETGEGLKTIDVCSLLPIIFDAVSKIESDLESQQQEIASLKKQITNEKGQLLVFLGDSKGETLQFENCSANRNASLTISTSGGEYIYSSKFPANESLISFKRGTIPKGVYIAVLSDGNVILQTITFCLD